MFDNLFTSNNDPVKEILAFSEGICEENLRGPFSITFEELENGTIAHVDEYCRIFFPQNFSPIPGQEYRGYYVQTLTGVYVYRGVRHRVCRVYLADTGAKTVSSFKEKPKGNSPFAEALKGFKARR